MVRFPSLEEALDDGDVGRVGARHGAVLGSEALEERREGWRVVSGSRRRLCGLVDIQVGEPLANRQ